MEVPPQKMHLRYLNLLGNTKVERLIKSIFNIQNFQTLILGYYGLDELAKDTRGT